MLEKNIETTDVYKKLFCLNALFLLGLTGTTFGSNPVLEEQLIFIGMVAFIFNVSFYFKPNLDNFIWGVSLVMLYSVFRGFNFYLSAFQEHDLFTTRFYASFGAGFIWSYIFAINMIILMRERKSGRLKEINFNRSE